MSARPGCGRPTVDAPRTKLPPSVAALGTIAWLTLVVLVGLLQVSPPDALAADAPPAQFSSARAMEHVRAIAGAPHPMGSPENARVREYLLGQLEQEGLSPRVQSSGPARNVVARLEGTGGGDEAVLLASHYDSVPTGPGASDDGAGVAAMLEASRALRAGPPLRNDVILLFTDGEEAGLLGAKEFVGEHPWARDAGLVLNFEARGTSGASWMFETSGSNGRLVEGFAEAAQHPVTSSLGPALYELLPNDTDLTVFKDAGYPGLNFAYVDGWINYHTPQDSIENLHESSLQHQGSYALSLARHFGNTNLDELEADDAIFFSLLGSFVVRYPEAWAVPLVACLTVLLVAVLALGFVRKGLTPRGTLRGLLVLAASMAGTVVTLTLILLLSALREGPLTNEMGATPGSHLYSLGSVALAVAITASVYATLGRKTSPSDLLAGALLPWGAAAALSTLFLPGASYLFSWPLLFGLLTLVTLLAAPHTPTIKALVVLVSVVPILLLLTPALYAMFLLAPVPTYGVIAALVVLVLGLLTPQLGLMAAPGRWLLPGTAAVTTLAMLVSATAYSA